LYRLLDARVFVEPLALRLTRVGQLAHKEIGERIDLVLAEGDLHHAVVGIFGELRVVADGDRPARLEGADERAGRLAGARVAKIYDAVDGGKVRGKVFVVDVAGRRQVDIRRRLTDDQQLDPRLLRRGQHDLRALGGG